MRASETGWHQESPSWGRFACVESQLSELLMSISKPVKLVFESCNFCVCFLTGYKARCKSKARGLFTQREGWVQ